MRFDEALEILVDHCAAVSPSLAAATGPMAVQRGIAHTETIFGLRK